MKAITIGLSLLFTISSFANISKVLFQQDYEEVTQIYDYYETHSKLDSSWYRLNAEVTTEVLSLTTFSGDESSKIYDVKKSNDSVKSVLNPDLLGLTLSSMRTNMQTVVVAEDFSWRKSSNILTFPKLNGFSVSKAKMEELFLQNLILNAKSFGHELASDYGLTYVCASVELSALDCSKMNELMLLCSLDKLSTKVLVTNEQQCPSGMKLLN